MLLSRPMTTESSKCGFKHSPAQFPRNPFLIFNLNLKEEDSGRSGPVDRRSEALCSPSLPRVPLLQPDPELERRAELLSGQAQRPGHRDLHGGGPAPGPDRRRPGRRLDWPPFHWNRQVAVVGRKRSAVQFVLGWIGAQLFRWPESLRRNEGRGLERSPVFRGTCSCVPRWWVETILVWFKIQKVSLTNCK